MTKLAQIRELWANGDRRAALSIAARFPRLGAHKETITRGQAAVLSPRFYTDIGHDPEELERMAYVALVELYDLPITER